MVCVEEQGRVRRMDVGKELRGRSSGGARIAVEWSRPSLPPLLADRMKKRRGRILRKSIEQGYTPIKQCEFLPSASASENPCCLLKSRCSRPLCHGDNIQAGWRQRTWVFLLGWMIALEIRDDSARSRPLRNIEDSNLSQSSILTSAT